MTVAYARSLRTVTPGQGIRYIQDISNQKPSPFTIKAPPHVQDGRLPIPALTLYTEGV
jgi:hypothetical protein